MIYRKDKYKAAGVRSTPKSLAQFQAAGQKLMKKYGKQRNYSALYFPGRYVWASMSFVYDYGGAIAQRKNGKWQGTLNSPQSIQGLTKLKQIVTSLSRANKTGDEANPQQALVFSKGRVGVVHRQWLGMALCARQEAREPLARQEHGRIPDAEPHCREVHAGVPGRLRCGRPGDEQEQGARL